MPTMTAAEAAVATLIGHGLSTLYAVPGVHNDHLFDALFKAAPRLKVVHARHEQGAAYMALGAAMATARSQAFAVVPGPGFLNAGAALLTAYAVNAQVLGLIGQIPKDTIGRGTGELHEIRDQAGIITRLVDTYRHITGPEDASRLVAEAFRGMATGRPGPAVVECPIDVWGKSGEAPLSAPLDVPAPALDEDALKDAARRLAGAKRPLIVCGGGAQSASAQVTALSALLQAPVLGYRRGRGVLDSRDPLSVTLPLGHELWKEADLVIGIGSRLTVPLTQWGYDAGMDIIRIDADPQEPARIVKPSVALIGPAAPVLDRLLAALAPIAANKPSRSDEMKERQARWQQCMRAQIGPQLGFLDAIRAELPENGIFVDEVTQHGFAARLALPVYRPHTFLSPGYQDNLGWGFATALGAQHARPDVPVVAISGDGGFMYTANEMATAVHHKIPLTAIVFADGAFGNVKRIQQERFGNRMIASDLTNPDFVKFAESFGARGLRARTPEELRAALRESFAQRAGPTLIEVPVGPLPSPWEFIFLPKVRGV